MAIDRYRESRYPLDSWLRCHFHSLSSMNDCGFRNAEVGSSILLRSTRILSIVSRLLSPALARALETASRQLGPSRAAPIVSSASFKAVVCLTKYCRLSRIWRAVWLSLYSRFARVLKQRVRVRVRGTETESRIEVIECSLP
jgi:hypothetical protein